MLAGGDVLANEAAPELALLEGFHVDAGDDAEVAGAAFEGFEEVGVGFGVGVDDLAGGEDDFEVEDVVTDEAEARREEGEAAWRGGSTGGLDGGPWWLAYLPESVRRHRRLRHALQRWRSLGRRA